MRRLRELVEKNCPNGVKYELLSDIARTITTGKLNANARQENGVYPFYTCDSTPYRINQYAFDEEAILISGNGSQVGHINYYKGKFNAYQRTYVLYDFSGVDIKYLLHYLNCYLREYILINSKKGSVPYITLPMLNNFRVPIPPIEIQKEIVNILDRFTESTEGLVTELTEELIARKKQYEYYRDELFKVSSNTRLVKLEEISDISRGGNFKKEDFIDQGVPCIHYGQIYTIYGIHADKAITNIKEEAAKKAKYAIKNDIIMAVTSENIQDVCKSVAWLGEEDIAIGGHTAIIKHKQNAKYLSYYFSTSMFSKQKAKLAQGTKVLDVAPNKLLNVEIPLPSLERQEEIANALDRFNNISTDISEKISIEIEMRNKQYDYYRDKLLTFKKLEE